MYLNKIMIVSISSLFLLSFSASSFAEIIAMEKCSGIVKSGKADGQSIVKGKKVDWILVPAGACIKLVGGKLIIDKKK